MQVCLSHGCEALAHQKPRSAMLEVSVSSISLVKSFLESAVFRQQMCVRICMSLSSFSLGFSSLTSLIVALQVWLGVEVDLCEEWEVSCPFSGQMQERWPCFQHLKHQPSFFNFSCLALVSFYNLAMSTCMVLLSCCFFFS